MSIAEDRSRMTNEGSGKQGTNHTRSVNSQSREIKVLKQSWVYSLDGPAPQTTIAPRHVTYRLTILAMKGGIDIQHLKVNLAWRHCLRRIAWINKHQTAEAKRRADNSGCIHSALGGVSSDSDEKGEWCGWK